MPPSGALQKAAGTFSFTTLLSRMLDRLAAAVSLNPTDPTDPTTIAKSSIRTVAAPDQDISEYLSEPGLLIRLRSPEPEPLSGGGRHDYRVSRIVDVFILTMSLQDPGGRDENAVRGHLLREEEVYDALHDQPPPGTPQNNSIPVTFKWVPGGAEIARQVRVDPGMLVSVLSFQIKYRGFMTVFRST